MEIGPAYAYEGGCDLSIFLSDWCSLLYRFVYGHSKGSINAHIGLLSYLDLVLSAFYCWDVLDAYVLFAMISSCAHFGVPFSRVLFPRFYERICDGLLLEMIIKVKHRKTQKVV